jgi:hypothetical protein
MKVCITCQIPKSLDEFGNYKRYPDGKHRICRTCHNGYVNKHRWAHGTIPEKPLLERLWDGIQQCGHGDDCVYCCWPWTKGTDDDGYGFISISNQGHHGKYRAHRILWEIWHALPLPDDQALCHYCDFPPCGNPHHLWPGTWIDNRLDCVAKGRQARGMTSGHATHPEAFPRGEKHFKAKLTEADVRAIRTLYAEGGITSIQLSAQYGVSKFAILCVINRKTWTHI